MDEKNNETLDRLWDALMEMAKIGPGVAGGNNRQALTDEDSDARHLFKRWCEEAKMTVSVDKMGTMFATREGTDPDALPVYVGSHLDTQPTGGKYDGILGVLAGLEIVRTLNETGIKTKHPIVVVNFTNEEGTRFPPAMVASGEFFEVHTLDWAYSRKDADGKTFGEELERIGWIGEEDVGSRKMRAFFELHIEQGPILEKENKQIGIVTHGQGLVGFQLTLTGKESYRVYTHAYARVNAGLGMAQITQLVHDIAIANAPLAVGASVGHATYFQTHAILSLGRLYLLWISRHPEKSTLEAMKAQLKAGAKEIAKNIGLEIEIESVGGFDPVTFDSGCVESIRNAADKLGYSRDLVSGTGHDACWINRVAPTAMVMCPCVDGLSHNEAEEIYPEWATAGANVLFHAVVETAKITD